MFVFYGEHSLGWPFNALVEMPHTGSRILSDVLSLERKLKDRVQARQFSVDRSSSHCSLWVPRQRLAASVIAVLHDGPLINLRQLAVPKVVPQMLVRKTTGFSASICGTTLGTAS